MPERANEEPLMYGQSLLSCSPGTKCNDFEVKARRHNGSCPPFSDFLNWGLSLVFLCCTFKGRCLKTGLRLLSTLLSFYTSFRGNFLQARARSAQETSRNPGFTVAVGGGAVISDVLYPQPSRRSLSAIVMYCPKLTSWSVLTTSLTTMAVSKVKRET